MLKFDPDDPDDDDPSGAPPKITVKLGGDDVRPSEPSDSGGVPDKSRQNTQHEEQKVKGAFIISSSEAQMVDYFGMKSFNFLTHFVENGFIIFFSARVLQIINFLS